MRPVILDLCAGSGRWSEPYRDSGVYDVRLVSLPEADVRLERYITLSVHGILAAPPRTVFAKSGARWPRSDDDYREALAVVDACLRAVVIYRPAWWALENPAGKLSRWLGPATMWFDPCDYGDPYTKRTYLWGSFSKPVPLALRVMPEEKSRIYWMRPGADRAARRSITPAAFARAFFEANP